MSLQTAMQEAALKTARQMMAQLEELNQQDPEGTDARYLSLYFYLLGLEDNYPTRDAEAETHALADLLLELASSGKKKMWVQIYGDHDTFVAGPGRPNIPWLGGLYLQMGYLEVAWGHELHFTDVVRTPSQDEQSFAAFFIRKT